MDGEQQYGGTSPIVVEDGDWKGWSLWRGGDPYEDHAGPFYFRAEADGTTRCAFRVEKKHLNGSGFLHGGCLMTFADYALFVIGREALGADRAVTATLNGEFVGAVSEGDLVEATGEVVKAGRSMVFLRGLVTSGGEPVMSFSASLKKVGPRK